MVHGQPANPDLYFPLSVGNHWSYSGGRTQVTVTSTITIDDKQYFILESATLGDDTLTINDDYSIARYNSGDEFTIYDFTIPDTSSYTVPYVFPTERGESWAREHPVTARYPMTYRVPVGEFTDVVKLVFCPCGADGDINLLFAPGVGMIAMEFGWGRPSKLEEAIVNGQVITAIDLEPPGNTNTDVSIYPNPARSVAQLQYGLRSLGSVVISLHDVLGRRVREITNSTKGPGEHTESVDVSSLPNGIYFFHVTTGSTYETHPFTIMH